MRRPLCWLCLLMMLTIVLLKNWGFSFWGKTPNSILSAEQEERQISLEEKLKAGLQVQVSGIVEKRAVSEKAEILYLKHTQVKIEEKIYFPGKIKMLLKTKKPVNIGSGIKGKGVLEAIPAPRNPGEFDSRNYEACQHVFYQIRKGELEEVLPRIGYREYLERIREKFLTVLEENAGEQAGIFAAMILGEKSLMEKETKTLYQMAGIVHILAISGLHLSMIGMGLFTIFRFFHFSNGIAGFLSVGLIYLYGILTGGGTATLRAVVMMMLAIGGKVIGRTYDLLTALAVGGMILLLDTPEHLWSSGFLLSFGAVLGMGMIYPLLREGFSLKNKILLTLLDSLSVQVMTLPIQLWFYYEISVCGFFLNLLVLPTVGAVLLSGLAGMLLGLFWKQGAEIVLLPGRGLLFFYEKLCKGSTWIPFGIWVAGRPEWQQVMIYYGLVSFGMLFLYIEIEKQKKTKKKSEKTEEKSRFFWKKGEGKAGFVFCFLLAVWVLGLNPKPELSITCLDVGQGDGIVITTETGRVFLCDGGSSSESAVGTYRMLPYLKYKGYSTVDGIFITHTDADHISGILEILKAQAEKMTSVKVKNLYLPDWRNPPKEYEELCELAEKAQISVSCLHKGQRFTDGKLQIRVLHPEKKETPEDINESGLVLELTEGAFRGLLTGDIGRETEEKLEKDLQPCDFLKVGHHGSRNSTSSEFLQKLKPQIAFISCSENNTYGHPSPETLERLKEKGVHTYITKDCGALTLIVTEKGMRVEGKLKKIG